MFKTEIFNHGCTCHFPSLDLKITALNMLPRIARKKLTKKEIQNKQRGSDFESFKFSCYSVSAEYTTVLT